MRPAGARASNPPTVQTGLWADLGPRSATPPPKTTPRKKPETLAEENARLRARVAELEAVASMAGPARRCEAAQLDVSSAAEPIRQRLEQQRTTILRLEALVERQAKALDATDADGAATEELLDRLARALRGVAELGDGAAPYHTEESKATPPKKLQASLLRTVEALRGRADASKRERRDAALGLDSDAARDRRAARAPSPPRAPRRRRHHQRLSRPRPRAHGRRRLHQTSRAIRDPPGTTRSPRTLLRKRPRPRRRRRRDHRSRAPSGRAIFNQCYQ